jgi:hypothetical protein
MIQRLDIEILVVAEKLEFVLPAMSNYESTHCLQVFSCTTTAQGPVGSSRTDCLLVLASPMKQLRLKQIIRDDMEVQTLIYIRHAQILPLTSSLNLHTLLFIANQDAVHRRRVAASKKVDCEAAGKYV